MNREEFVAYISNEYGISEECPWAQYPSYSVFRHPSNRKWFAVVMDVPRNRLGLDGTDPLVIANLKADPLLLDALRKEPGFFPAYHMSKTHWISVALDASVENDKIKMLLALSYDITAPKRKAKK